MEPMKPDAVNVGSPKYQIGELLNWTHDMFLDKYDVSGACIVVDNKEKERDNTKYSIHVLLTGTVITCFDRNLRPYKP
jgi:hypothetical protein